MIPKCLPITPFRFSNNLFAERKCILPIENLTSYKKKFGYQAFNEKSADQFNVACSFEIWNKKLC